MPTEEHICPVRAVTRGPKAHFFGYYDKPPWDASGRWLLALEAEAVDRMPQPGEAAVVGVVDLETGRFDPVAETRAWNWQQGCMLQWLPSAPDREIVYNDCVDGRHVAVVLDVHTGRRRLLPRPIYSVAHDGRSALSISLARLAHARPIVGYAGVADPWADDPHPAEDGVWWMDLATGESRLVVSLDRVARFEPEATMRDAAHRFEHVTLAPGDRRFFFLQRWPRLEKGRPFHDRLLTAGVDGADLHVLATGLVSHFDWRDPDHVLAWASAAERGTHFHLFTDRTAEVETVGADVLTKDGHCSYSPDRRWILSDVYPDVEWRTRLLVYEVAANRRVDVGRFHAPRRLYQVPGIRCDLHPRWSRDGCSVCIDSAHEGARQMYVVDVSAVVG